MNAGVFQALRKLAYERAGIALRENKQSLMSARIAKRMRSLGLASEGEYLDYLLADRGGDEMVQFLDAISTNFTSFFREDEHFRMLDHEARQWADSGARRVRLWCAASSTGEEPYTLAMTLAEAFGQRQIDWKILASDISTRALAAASAGQYEASRLARVPKELVRKYFAHKPASSAGEPVLEVRRDLRQRILFRRINLATPPFPMRGGLDAVFCRNVMIYFDNAVRQRLISEVERILRPGGLLVVAHSETLNGVESGLRTVCPSVYRKVSA
jgi:chemotaxis protein methyltransferase CheR